MFIFSNSQIMTAKQILRAWYGDYFNFLFNPTQDYSNGLGLQSIIYFSLYLFISNSNYVVVV